MLGPMRSTIAIILLPLLAACSRHPQVVVVNESHALLRAVVVSGTGFESALGDLAPGASIAVEVAPTGETGLSLSFERDGARATLGPQGYFENSGSYSVRAVVAKDGTLRVDDASR